MYDSISRDDLTEALQIQKEAILDLMGEVASCYDLAHNALARVEMLLGADVWDPISSGPPMDCEGPEDPDLLPDLDEGTDCCPERAIWVDDSDMKAFDDCHGLIVRRRRV